MNEYKYYVSALPDDWADGKVFSKYVDAEEHAQKFGECITEVTYEFSDSELVWDGRDVPEEEE